MQPVAGGSKAAIWASRAALHKPVGCPASNIHCTVKASQDFEISWGQISLEFNTNRDNTLVSARRSWKSLYTVILDFHLSPTHSLGCLIIGAISFSITNLNLLAIHGQNSFHHPCALPWLWCRDLCVVVWEPGAQLCGGWFGIFSSLRGTCPADTS